MVELPEHESHTELQQVIFSGPRLRVVADFEAHAPTIVKPVVEPSAIMNQVDRSISEG
jgi:hypothetical protein